MSSELCYAGHPSSDTGSTVTAEVYTALGIQVGGTIACSEVASTAIFLGDMPATTAGTYLVRFFLDGEFAGQGTQLWDGSNTVTGNLAVDVLENGETILESLRLIRAEAAGKLLVNGNRVTIRDAADSKNRITADTDPHGQRYVVTVDVSE